MYVPVLRSSYIRILANNAPIHQYFDKENTLLVPYKATNFIKAVSTEMI